MNQPEPTPTITRVERVTTTRLVHAEFEGPSYASDLTLSELRAVVAAAAELPGESLVTLYADDAWQTPKMLRIECEVQRPIEDNDIARADEQLRAFRAVP